MSLIEHVTSKLHPRLLLQLNSKWSCFGNISPENYKCISRNTIQMKNTHNHIYSTIYKVSKSYKKINKNLNWFWLSTTVCWPIHENYMIHTLLFQFYYTCILVKSKIYIFWGLIRYRGGCVLGRGVCYRHFPLLLKPWIRN